MTHTRSLRLGLLLGLGGATAALASPGVVGEASAPSPAVAAQADAAGLRPVELGPDGVGMLFPSHPSGSSWALGSQDPNTTDPLFWEMNGPSAARGSENGLRYWTATGQRVTYASGQPDGKTVRLYIRPGGGQQSLTWRSGAESAGYIGTPQDLLNFEATIYVRVREDNGTHKSMSWKMRGGKHTKPEVARASCVGMDVPFGGVSPRAFRELDHPTYDHVTLAPRFPFQLQEGQWLGVKVVSYLVEGGTRNLLFLDTEPFLADGTPRNGFRLYTEWVDRDGESTGHYSKAATWAGWETTFRVDGWRQVDFALPSAREILPPTE